MEIASLLLILAGLFIGWNIGANDAANCLGTSVGAGLIGYKKAALAVAIMVLIGAALQGQKTITTMGSSIADPLGLSTLMLFTALLVAGIVVALCTVLSLPASTTQAVIGAIAGLGLATSTSVNWAVIAKIFFLGFMTPIIAALLSFFTYYVFGFVLGHINKRVSFFSFDTQIKWLVLLSGVFVAYSLGANNIGNSVGIIVGKGLLLPFTASLAGGIAISIGVTTFGRNVMKTVGTKITTLDSKMALSAQTGAGIAVYILTLLGIPTSTTFGIVGGVAGVGLVKGVSSVDRETLKVILLGWILTPLATALLTFVILLVLPF